MPDMTFIHVRMNDVERILNKNKQCEPIFDYDSFIHRTSRAGMGCALDTRKLDENTFAFTSEYGVPEIVFESISAIYPDEEVKLVVSPECIIAVCSYVVFKSGRKITEIAYEYDKDTDKWVDKDGNGMIEDF